MNRVAAMVTGGLLGALLGSMAQPASAEGPAKQQPGRSPMQQGVMQGDAYWESEKGLDLLRYMDAVNAGKMSTEDARKAFRQKWYDGKDPQIAPAVPLVPIPGR